MTWKKPKGVLHFRVADDVCGPVYACAHPLSSRPYLHTHQNKMTANPNKVTCKWCLKSVKLDTEEIQTILEGRHSFMDLNFYVRNRICLSMIPIWRLNRFDFEYDPNYPDSGYWCIMEHFYNLLDQSLCVDKTGSE